MKNNESEEVKKRRNELLKETEDLVRQHISPPWTNPLYDYVLYKQMNAIGIRAADLRRLIEQELKRTIPGSG